MGNIELISTWMFFLFGIILGVIGFTMLDGWEGYAFICIGGLLIGYNGASLFDYYGG